MSRNKSSSTTTTFIKSSSTTSSSSSPTTTTPSSSSSCINPSPLPKIVQTELEYRTNFLSRHQHDSDFEMPNPKPHVIAAFRSHYNDGKFSPLLSSSTSGSTDVSTTSSSSSSTEHLNGSGGGAKDNNNTTSTTTITTYTYTQEGIGVSGALSILQRLGDTNIYSKERIVKDVDANVAYERSVIKYNECVDRHREELRLLRYSEFVDNMTSITSANNNNNNKRGGTTNKENKAAHVTIGEFILPTQSEYESQEKEVDTGDYGQDVEYNFVSDRLHKQEFKALFFAFTMGYFYYCNLDRITKGLAAGFEYLNVGVKQSCSSGGEDGTTNKNGRKKGNGSSDAMTEIDSELVERSTSAMMKQCQELKQRYQQQKSPLGSVFLGINMQKANGVQTKGITTQKSSSSSSSITKTTKTCKISNKPPKKSTMEQHEEIIDQKLSQLFKSLLETIKRPAIEYAYFMKELIEMFNVAIKYDPTIATSFCKQAGTYLLKLRQIFVTYAKNIDHVLLMPKLFADQYWMVYYAIGDLLAEAVYQVIRYENDDATTFTTHDKEEDEPSSTTTTRPTTNYSKKDTNLAINFFKRIMLPELMKGAQSESIGEQMSTWQCVENVLRGFNEKVIHEILLDTKLFDIIQSTALSSYNHDYNTWIESQEWSTQRVKARASFHLPIACRTVINLMNELWTKSVDEETLKPGPIGQMILEQQETVIMPLYFNAAKSNRTSSSDSTTSSPMTPFLLQLVAINGLRRLVYAQEFRDFLYEEQYDVTIELIHELLMSNDGVIVKDTIGLVVALLGNDKQWFPPIIKMDPPVEDICMKVGVCGVKAYCARLQKAKSDYQDLLCKRKEKFERYSRIARKRTKTIDDKKFLLEFNKFKQNLNSKAGWCDLELNQVDKVIDGSLGNPIRLMSMFLCYGEGEEINRLHKARCLDLVAMVLDSKQDHLYKAAFDLLYAFICLCSNVKVTDFPDPHRFVESLIEKQAKGRVEDKDERVLHILNQLLCYDTNWVPIVVQFKSILGLIVKRAT